MITKPSATPEDDPAASKRNRFAPIVLTCLVVVGLVWYLQNQAGLEKLAVGSRSSLADQPNHLMIGLSKGKVVAHGKSGPWRPTQLLTDQRHHYEDLLRVHAGDVLSASEPADIQAYPHLKRVTGFGRHTGRVREDFSLWQLDRQRVDKSAHLPAIIAHYTAQAQGKGYRLLSTHQGDPGDSVAKTPVHLQFTKTIAGQRQLLVVRIDPQPHQVHVLVWLQYMQKV